jgi:superfamily II DNA/RNA helicase
MSFKELGVNPALVKALVAAGIEKPFPIQKATLPDAISGKDILGRGQTGSGKTLAFGLALMTRLAGKTAAPMKPLGLVLSPTRELAMQISDVIAPLSRTVNLNSQVVAGGLSYSKQIQALKRGVPIVVATPGRLIDLINKKHIKLDDVQITILDEADQMADMGFLPDVKKILDQTKPGGQRMLFSATLDRDVDSLVKKYLKNPVTHSLANEKSTAGNMTHHVLVMEQANKDAITASIAARKGKSIFFVRTKHGADKLAKRMNESGVAVGALHGGKTQAQRSRVLEGFKMGKTNALVATDVAARGIHVDDVSLVVHVDAPENHKDYLHRAGRTARAGAVGTVVTLSTHKQVKGVRGLAARAGVKLVETKVGPMDQNLVKITGAIEPSGVPIVATDGGKGEKSERSGRSRGGYGDSRSRGGGKKKKSRPRPNERRKRPR